MQAVDPDDPRLKQRPLLGMLILLLPALGVAIVFVLYGGMWALGTGGRAPTGAVAELTFDACPQARQLMAERLTDMGLTDAVWRDLDGGVSVTLTQTGDAAIDARLPAVLSMPGALEIRGGDTVLATSSDIADATVRLDMIMVPSVLLDLGPEAAERVKQYMRRDPGGDVTFFVDGELVGRMPNLEPVAVGQLEIMPDHITDERDRMVAVAEWSVVLDHAPLPCDVRPL